MDEPIQVIDVEEGVQQGLQMTHRIGLLAFSLILLLAILELVRRGHLKERYALLWLATGVVGLVVGLFPGIIVKVSHLVHFQYLTMLFVTSFLFLLGLVLSFTVVISRLVERNRRLTQEVALLDEAVRRLEKRVED
ncbi:MAG: DUF2304 domain-containing protein [bacterium]|nr:DUF2304 domain-containing protein [bacterium]